MNYQEELINILQEMIDNLPEATPDRPYSHGKKVGAKGAYADCINLLRSTTIPVSNPVDINAVIEDSFKEGSDYQKHYNTHDDPNEEMGDVRKKLLHDLKEKYNSK